MKKPPLINLVMPIVGASTITAAAVVAPVVDHFFPSVYQQIYECAINEFLDFCKIPHIANNCDADEWNPERDSLTEMREYLTGVIQKELGSDAVYTDYNGNMWWDIPATKGSEGLAPIALQGHMDMVWDAQGEARQWDPYNHPVATPVFDYVNGKKVIHTRDWLTSLGSDDGQGIGLLLALTKKRDLFQHPRLRCLITVDEETSGRGADRLGENESREHTQDVLGDIPYLINIDGGPIGQINISSGASLGFRYSMLLDTESVDHIGKHVYTIQVSGGRGGHSGVDIDKNPCNAVGVVSIAASRLFLHTIRDAELIGFDSGIDSSRTKIPSEASIKFITSLDPETTKSHFKEIEEWFEIFIEKYNEPNMKISLIVEDETEETRWTCINHEKTVGVITSLVSFPFGVYARAEDGSVSVSSNISPVIYVAGDPSGFVFETLTRYNSTKKGMECLLKVSRAIRILIDYVKQWGGHGWTRLEMVDRFPVWEESNDLTFANYVKDEFTKSDIANPYLFRCHPGLECGFFYNNYPNINQVSVGANVLNEHNIREMLDLESYYQLVKSMINVFNDFNFKTPVEVVESKK